MEVLKQILAFLFRDGFKVEFTSLAGIVNFTLLFVVLFRLPKHKANLEWYRDLGESTATNLVKVLDTFAVKLGVTIIYTFSFYAGCLLMLKKLCPHLFDIVKS
jgi:hypothetical protein